MYWRTSSRIRGLYPLDARNTLSHSRDNQKMSPEGEKGKITPAESHSLKKIEAIWETFFLLLFLKKV